LSGKKFIFTFEIVTDPVLMISTNKKIRQFFVALSHQFFVLAAIFTANFFYFFQTFGRGGSGH
jgi:hypothetical protein